MNLSQFSNACCKNAADLDPSMKFYSKGVLKMMTGRQWDAYLDSLEDKEYLLSSFE